jgi:hypothetical protein
VGTAWKNAYRFWLEPGSKEHSMTQLSAGVPFEAVQTLQKFLDAGQRRDEQALKACLSRRTLESGQFDPAGPEGVRCELGEGQMDGETAIIPLKLIPLDAPADAPPAMVMPCVMLNEDGQWKLDLPATMERMMGGGIDAAMEQVATVMSTAMEGVGQALADGLGQVMGGGSTGPADAALNCDDAPLQVQAEELLPLAEMTPLPKLHEMLSGAVGSPVVAQAAIADLLRQLGSDERDVLVNWFEGQLFGAWGELLTQAAQQVPLKGRLRALRIEAANYSDDRFVALDGSDLVYRMWLNHTDGYYSDAGLAELLPGVLAGLPETIDDQLAGRRLLPTDEESPSLEVYRAHAVPRFMRRIGALLGRNVNLDVNWDDADATLTARQLSRWGLNRIHGAIALACQDASQREALGADPSTVRIVLGFDVSKRYARYEAGTLEIGLNHYAGEKGCFYEHDLARVLAGQPIAYEG